MTLSYEEMTEMGMEAGERFRSWAGAVTDEDRKELKERFGVSPDTHDIFRGPLPVWESTFALGGCTFVVVENSQTIWFSPRR
jgi:hypothetical protein